MNEEIKEILDRIKGHYVLDAEQDMILLNYITNLQEENQKLKEDIEEISTSHFLLFKRNGKIEEENQKLNKIIDELEKWLNEEIIVNKTNQIEVPNYPEWYIKWNCYLNILNKLTELKNEVK